MYQGMKNTSCGDRECNDIVNKNRKIEDHIDTFKVKWFTKLGTGNGSFDPLRVSSGIFWAILLTHCLAESVCFLAARS